MSHRDAPATPRPSRWRRLALTFVLLALLAGVVGVGYKLVDAREVSLPGKSAKPSETPTEDPVVRNVAVGAVVGKLPQDQADAVAGEVEGLVGDYLDWAFLGDYPRTDWSTPPPGFTPRAGKQFLKDMRTMPGLTNQPRGAELTKVSQVVEDITVDVLAPKGEPAGATGHYKISFLAESSTEPLQITTSGRLILAPVDGTWQIVGYYAGESQTGGQA